MQSREKHGELARSEYHIKHGRWHNAEGVFFPDRVEYIIALPHWTPISTPTYGYLHRHLYRSAAFT